MSVVCANIKTETLLEMEGLVVGKNFCSGNEVDNEQKKAAKKRLQFDIG
jgi:hypothetical protein